MKVPFVVEYFQRIEFPLYFLVLLQDVAIVAVKILRKERSVRVLIQEIGDY